METGRYYVRRYHTARGQVRQAVVFKGRKYYKACMWYDGAPKLFNKIKFDEGRYMDCTDYPLERACLQMLRAKSRMEKQAIKFLEKAKDNPGRDIQARP